MTHEDDDDNGVDDDGDAYGEALLSIQIEGRC